MLSQELSVNGILEPTQTERKKKERTTNIKENFRFHFRCRIDVNGPLGLVHIERKHHC